MRTFASIVKHALVLGTALAVAAGAAAAQESGRVTRDKARPGPASMDAEAPPPREDVGPAR